MSKSRNKSFKREPKNKSDLKGLRKINPACCGMTCCGAYGKVARGTIRAHRRQQKKQAIQESLLDL